MAFKMDTKPRQGFDARLLAGSPRLLLKVAEAAKKANSIECLLAYLLLQLIDSRASNRQPVIKEYSFFMTQYVRDGAPFEINLPTDLRKRIDWAAFAGADAAVRQDLLDALNQMLLESVEPVYEKLHGQDSLVMAERLMRRTSITESEILDAYQTVRKIGLKVEQETRLKVVNGIGPAPETDQQKRIRLRRDDPKISRAHGTGIMKVFNKIAGR